MSVSTPGQSGTNSYLHTGGRPALSGVIRGDPCCYPWVNLARP